MRSGHDTVILLLCRAIKRPADFDIVLQAMDYVTDEEAKQEIDRIAKRLYHMDECGW